MSSWDTRKARQGGRLWKADRVTLWQAKGSMGHWKLEGASKGLLRLEAF